MARLNWDDLRVFLAVARSGQLLSAAKRLGVNHATVSRRLQQLESGLGQTLVHRRTHGCDLTDAGRQLQAVAERMERDVLSVGEGEASDAINGTVRVGAPGSAVRRAAAGAARRATPGYPCRAGADGAQRVDLASGGGSGGDARAA